MSQLPLQDDCWLSQSNCSGLDESRPEDPSVARGLVPCAWIAFVRAGSSSESKSACGDPGTGHKAPCYVNGQQLVLRV
jgi:hypothetical protein